MEPVIAGEDLTAGDEIGFLPDGRVGQRAEKKLGIVDPFVTGVVRPGQMFWLVVFPRQITSLRHVWEHPDFETAARKDWSEKDDEAKAWAWEIIKQEADRVGTYGREKITAEELIEGAQKFLDHGETMVSGYDTHYFEDVNRFWRAFEAVTGREVPAPARDSFFSCSC